MSDLYYRIFNLHFFAQQAADYILQNRHQLPESFVQEVFAWYRNSITFLREQKEHFEQHGSFNCRL